MRKIILSSVFFVLMALSCANVTKHSKPTTQSVNPNPDGDSEMSLLMREMLNDALRMKKAVEAGQKPKLLRSFIELETAEATRESKVDNDEFRAFTDHYLDLLQRFERSSVAESSSIYTGMIQTCMNCHAAVCPGPMVRIKQLYLAN